MSAPSERLAPLPADRTTAASPATARPATRPAARAAAPGSLLAGSAYVLAAAGFVGVFSWLAARFDYPRVLDGPAAEVLPALLALGSVGRAVWVAYALLPLLLLPAGAGVSTALRRADGATDATLALVRVLHAVAAVTMTAGLARWATLHWMLAEAWPGADPATRHVLAVVFDAANGYLGVALGEFVGELALYGAFVGIAAALRRNGAPRPLTMLAGATGLLGWVGTFRNLSPRVQPAADVVNWLLPLLLLALGGWLLRARPLPAR